MGALIGTRQEEMQIIEEAVSAFFDEGFEDNDVVSHDFLKFVLQIPEPESLHQVQAIQFVLLSRVEEFKKTLLQDHRIALDSVRGVGYRIVPPNEQALFACSEAARYIQKGLCTGMELLQYVRTDEMSADARKTHLDAQVKMHNLQAIITKERRDVFTVFSDNRKLKHDKTKRATA